MNRISCFTAYSNEIRHSLQIKPATLYGSKSASHCSVTLPLIYVRWGTSVLGSEWLTGELLDQLTHHVHILEINGDSYRLITSQHHQNQVTKII
ncbi:MAG: ATP-binding protein [Methylotenera sp.]|nr:ATP-binding protein [Methylotenera sp.]MDP1959104.1 ATP-binding protein [Methylotenera sp.]MDP3206484.1 ATP-binding protein [Methylotenera sp.]MDP3303740.1 ATP-binding protein [Methylotenera sp.]MDP3943322.1 ATP-binding protein [Methylotenera sp.]